MAGTKYSSFVSIASLVKSNLGERCLINILMNISTNALSDYLECAKIYKGASSKKKTNLVELIVYGHITNKVNKINLVDITKTERNQIFKKKRDQSKTYLDMVMLVEREKRPWLQLIMVSVLLQYVNK